MGSIAEIQRIRKDFAEDPKDALHKAGIWVDVPKPPEFEDVNELVTGRMASDHGISISRIFPIGEWTEAYTHFRYQVRIFSFSEHFELSTQASQAAMERILEIHDPDFYSRIRRSREL